jgi:hypothetical protein
MRDWLARQLTPSRLIMLSVALGCGTLVMAYAVFVERPSERDLLAAAHEYVAARNRGDWTAAFEREWLQLRPELGVTRDEYAAHLASTTVAEDRRSRPMAVKGAAVDGRFGTVVVVWPTGRQPMEAESLDRLGVDDAELRRTLLDPPQFAQVEAPWVYDVRRRRWFAAPTRATIELAPWFDRILADRGLPPLEDWVVARSWSGSDRKARFEFERGAGVWYLAWRVDDPSRLSFRVEGTDGGCVLSGPADDAAEGRSLCQDATGKLALVVECRDDCSYEFRLRAPLADE